MNTVCPISLLVLYQCVEAHARPGDQPCMHDLLPVLLTRVTNCRAFFFFSPFFFSPFFHPPLPPQVDRVLYILGQKGNTAKAGYRLQVLGTCERLLDLHREHPKVTETEVIGELAVRVQPQPTDQLTDRPTNQPTDQPTDQPTNQPTNPDQPTDRPTDQPTKQPTSQTTNQPTNQTNDASATVCSTNIRFSLSLSPPPSTAATHTPGRNA